MKTQSKIATSVGLMLLLACVSFAQEVKTDYDHNANETHARSSMSPTDVAIFDWVFIFPPHFRDFCCFSELWSRIPLPSYGDCFTSPVGGLGARVPVS